MKKIKVMIALLLISVLLGACGEDPKVPMFPTIENPVVVPTLDPQKAEYLSALINSLDDETRIPLSSKVEDENTLSVHCITEGYDIKKINGILGVNLVEHKVSGDHSVYVSDAYDVSFAHSDIFKFPRGHYVYKFCLIRSENRAVKLTEVTDAYTDSSGLNVSFQAEVQDEIEGTFEALIILKVQPGSYSGRKGLNVTFVEDERLTLASIINDTIPHIGEAAALETYGSIKGFDMDAAYLCDPNAQIEKDGQLIKTSYDALTATLTKHREIFDSDGNFVLGITEKPVLYDSEYLFGKDDGYLYLVFTTNLSPYYSSIRLDFAVFVLGKLNVVFKLYPSAGDVDDPDLVGIIKIKKESLLCDITDVEFIIDIAK